MDKDTIESDVSKLVESSRGPRIGFKSRKLIELNAQREKLENQRFQLEEELKELTMNKKMRRRMDWNVKKHQIISS